ncbi:hypothetical protein [Thalassolituus sp. C2-1]|uniref:hypothetical protein n=1 Tax=Venatorbacter sp. C2-1 TaxID=2597518 RepID=UPI00164936C8|nr:hypothetical protein [Thalassolituus sp. C2-1]
MFNAETAPLFSRAASPLTLFSLFAAPYCPPPYDRLWEEERLNGSGGANIYGLTLPPVYETLKIKSDTPFSFKNHGTPLAQQNNNKGKNPYEYQR